MKLNLSTARMGAIAVLCCLSAPAFAKTHHHGGGGSGCLPSSLRSTLSQVSQRFGHVEVISAHRPGATISGSGRRSLHADCRAVDFNPPPGKYKQVVAWLHANHSGGVGTYSCGMHHIHIDNGPSVHFHKCEGGDGGGRRYASRGGKSKRYASRSGGKRRYASL